jgi:hypothetical protein
VRGHGVWVGTIVYMARSGCESICVGRPLPSQRNPRLVRPRPPRPPTNHHRINGPSCTQCARLATPSNAHCTRCNSHMTSKCTLHTHQCWASPHTSSSHDHAPQRWTPRPSLPTRVVKAQEQRSGCVPRCGDRRSACHVLHFTRGATWREATLLHTHHTHAHTHTHTPTNSCTSLTQHLRIYPKG